MQEGDDVTILYGSGLPYILRRQVTGQYRLVGHCYVHDIEQDSVIAEYKAGTKTPTMIELV